MLVQIVLFDGFDLLDAIAPFEVFCAAETYSGGAIRAELVSAEGERLVPSGTNGVPICASGGIDSERAKIILVPGASGVVAGDGPDSVPFLLQKASETTLIQRVGEAFGKPDVIVATVCGGSLLLAMGGLLEGRYAVTHHLGMEVLGATGAVPVAARVVEDGNFISGGGVTSGLDVALYLVERELGPQISHAVEKLFEYERRGTVWQRRGIVPVPEGPQFSGETELSSASERLIQAPSATGNYAGVHTHESVFQGVWEVTISTPIGKMLVTLNISAFNGTISGTAKQGQETSHFIDPVVNGGILSWSQRITKPMHLNLKFEVSVEGNRMNGTAKAGLLPASKLMGERIS
ncbi:DJ-1/PfpI family protein [Paenibacillus thalictri]|uniref:DJ-1/PfpI family protein n=1 Tax=Paenibacillus thalictri TaxID=2527873 RepID=A0A4Q9DHW8_9BACL|nr:DJ-1/PfpI family protein [Paenibacillus thalictri]TBL72648.1 DJ-1/PfpI family protein [Paenibacillus thalictri]